MEAMISGDDALAQRHMHHYYDVADRELNPRYHQAAATHPTPSPLWRENRDSKSALALVYRIRHDMRRQGLQPGDRLGQEPQLVEQYAVSRAIFREAVRMVELVGLAEYRLGREGGLVVGQPNPDYTQSTAALFLGHAHYNLLNLNPLHAHMESFVARRAADNITDAQAAQLRALVQTEAGADPADLLRGMTEVHRSIARIAGNRIFSLYLEVLFVLNRVNPLDNASATARAHSAAFQRSHHRLVDAIVARDPNLASRRMLDHFALQAQVLPRPAAPESTTPG
jgi:DNA-binding FadR family transcriptional regulator